MTVRSYTLKELRALDSLRLPKDTNDSLFKASSDNIVVFAKHMLGLDLYYWQIEFLHEMQRVLDGSSRYDMVVANTSRQIGKSTCLAVFALWACVFNKRPDKRFQTTLVSIISRGGEQAKKLLREIKKTYRAGDRYMKSAYLDDDGNPVYGREFFSKLLSPDDPNNTTSISFVPHGHDGVDHGEFLLKGSLGSSGIRCYPPTPIVLGETFTIGMIDEAGHRDIPDTFWHDELYPTGDANEALWVFTSTPWEPKGFFYEHCDPENARGTSNIFKMVASIDILAYDKNNPSAQKQYLAVKKKIENYKRNGEWNKVRKIYYCEFVQGDKSFFPPEKVASMFSEEISMVDEYSGECDIGVDFGGKTSRTAYTISYKDVTNNRIVRLKHKRYEAENDDSLLADIEYEMTKFNIQRVIPDDCPAGWYRIGLMTKKGWNVQPMNFRSDKMKKFSAMKNLMLASEQTIFSYPDEQLRDEMYSIEYSEGSVRTILTTSNNMTDDMVDSFVMSMYFFLDSDSTGRIIEW